MKKLLVAILCAFALQTFAFGHSKAVERYRSAAQDQKEAKPYDIYVGQYEVSPGFILTITNENNKLMGQPTGDEKAEFKPQTGPDEFYSSTVSARLKFAKDQAGAVIAVVVTIDGKDFYSKKIK